jgi:hypothetical protein
MGVPLIGMHIIGMHLTGVNLIGVHLLQACISQALRLIGMSWGFRFFNLGFSLYPTVLGLERRIAMAG